MAELVFGRNLKRSHKADNRGNERYNSLNKLRHDLSECQGSLRSLSCNNFFTKPQIKRVASKKRFITGAHSEKECTDKQKRKRSDEYAADDFSPFCVKIRISKVEGKKHGYQIHACGGSSSDEYCHHLILGHDGVKCRIKCVGIKDDRENNKQKFTNRVLKQVIAGASVIKSVFLITEKLCAVFVTVEINHLFLPP